MTLTLQIVVVRILGHPPIKEGPGDVVHSVLLVLDGFGHHLGIEMVVKEVVQMRLEGDRQSTPNSVPSHKQITTDHMTSGHLFHTKSLLIT